MPTQLAKERPPSAVSPEVTQDEPAACAYCFGTGMEVVAGRGARRCNCREQERRQRLIEAAHTPLRYKRCMLANYRPDPGQSTQLLAFNYAFKLVNEYPAVERGLLFTGPVGTGKTHLAAAIIRRLIEKGVPYLFYEFGVLLKEIQNSYNPVSQASELAVHAPVYETEVLVLDDPGASEPTDWVRDTMMQIIGTRYNEQKLTIFTTNYGDARRHPAEETLEDCVGMHLRSGLYEMSRTMTAEGEDYRRKLAALV